MVVAFEKCAQKKQNDHGVNTLNNLKTTKERGDQFKKRVPSEDEE